MVAFEYLPLTFERGVVGGAMVAMRMSETEKPKVVQESKVVVSFKAWETSILKLI